MSRQAEEIELKVYLHKLLNTLPENEYVFITLYFLFGFTLDQVSKLVGYNESAIKQGVDRALFKLRSRAILAELKPIRKEVHEKNHSRLPVQDKGNADRRRRSY